MKLSEFAGKFDHLPKLRQSSLEELCEDFSHPLIRKNKDGAAFSFAVFRNDHRLDENVIEVSALGYDLDGKVELDEAVDILMRSGWKWILYTTHSHQRISETHPFETDCFRVFIFVKQPIPAEVYERVWLNVEARLFSGRSDPAVKNAGRLWYKPAIREPDAPFHFEKQITSESCLLDWSAFDIEPAPKEVRKPRTNGHNGNGNGYVQAAVANEIERLEQASKGERNNQLFKSAAAIAGFIPNGLINESDVRSQLESAALRTGLSAREIKRTIDSAIGTGSKEARQIPAPRPPIEWIDEPQEEALEPEPDTTLEDFNRILFTDREPEEQGCRPSQYISQVYDAANYFLAELDFDPELRGIGYALIGAANNSGELFTLPDIAGAKRLWPNLDITDDSLRKKFSDERKKLMAWQVEHNLTLFEYIEGGRRYVDGKPVENLPTQWKVTIMPSLQAIVDDAPYEADYATHPARAIERVAKKAAKAKRLELVTPPKRQRRKRHVPGSKEWNKTAISNFRKTLENAADFDAAAAEQIRLLMALHDEMAAQRKSISHAESLQVVDSTQSEGGGGFAPPPPETTPNFAPSIDLKKGGKNTPQPASGGANGAYPRSRSPD